MNLCDTCKNKTDEYFNDTFSFEDYCKARGTFIGEYWSCDYYEKTSQHTTHR